MVGPARADVGLEYLGPYPLQPQPIDGQPQTLQASGTIGNSGSVDAVYALSLVASQEFQTYFAHAFSENNFMLNPGQRKDFTVTFTCSPDTPIQDYSATISILATVPGGSGQASFNLPVSISASVVTPEFISPLETMVVAFAVAVFCVFASRRRKIASDAG